MLFPRVPVRDLQTGDVLLPTLREVVRPPYQSVKTPSGKLEVVVKSLEGRNKDAIKRHQWGRNTQVAVSRHVEEEG